MRGSKKKLEGNLGDDEQLVRLAEQVATRAHWGQKDKIGQDYISHPRRVAERVTLPKEKMAAWLHDVVEDSDLTEDDLLGEGFPIDVVRAVGLLTRVREADPDAYYRRIAANPLALTVKLADIADNTSPDRVVYLEAHDRVRLQKKYQHALMMLKDVQGPASIS